MRDTMVDSEVIEQALRLACRAPSLHNSQPWRWVLEGNAVQLFEDKDRVLYATDHSGREALLGCGAVLDHFRVAMAAAGWIANVDRFPNPNNPLLLASVDFAPIEFVTDGHRRRAEAILIRRTDRLPFAEPPDWKQVEARLKSAVSIDGVRLDVIPDEFRPELAEASQFSELSRLYDSSYHSELSRWTNPYDPTQGIPPSAFVSAEENERVDVGRNFPVTCARPTGALASVRTTPRSSCCRHTTTIDSVCCSVARCFRRYCWKRRWPAWQHARSRTSPSYTRAGTPYRR